MMNIRQLISIGMLALGTTSANAAIFFSTDAPASSVNITGCTTCSASLVNNLGSQSTTLDVNNTWIIDFFNLTFDGTGGAGTIDATLAFSDPAGAPSSGTGGTGYSTYDIFGLGTVTSGGILWTSQPGITTVGDVSFSVFFNDIAYFGGGSSATVIATATVTLLDDGAAYVPVPEPGSLTLLGLGLIGLVSARRRKKQT